MQRLTGYIEGYYGQLLSWTERRAIVDQLHELQQHYYWYAPKEDPLHRVQWREPYTQDWMSDFTAFCQYADARGIQVIAGVAPGLDFDFAALDSPINVADNDLTILVNKAQKLAQAGASVIGVLMDDIDADFMRRRGPFSKEGEAHAMLVNAVETSVHTPVIAVPRIYANTLVTESPDYLPAFARSLHKTIMVSLCGSDVVAPVITTDDFSRYADFSAHRIVAWDNLYANDYCPRRLFTGPWQGRGDVSEVMLNPTGLVCTDRLLLTLTAVDGQDLPARWDVLRHHGVPDCFEAIERFLWLPPFGALAGVEEAAESALMTPAREAAIEHLLWRWKTPLAREWYPFLMGLKTDLLIRSGRLADDRIRKTCTPALTGRLL